ICMSSRDPGPAVPAGVFTVESYRRLGFATAVVSAWAAEVTASGRLPLYGTTWDNEASQHIAASLGGVMYGSDYWLR
ncbi:MAG: GNAT family N-acetyltransferase, partial [Dehalococcoidia bacterium]